MSFFQRDKPVVCRVRTADAILEYSITTSTTGQELFEQVVASLGLREIWYFGLHFIDTKDVGAWVKMTKKIMMQDVPYDPKVGTPIELDFIVKYYPEDVVDEIIQDVTRHMFYKQTVNLVIADELYCPAETAILLSAFQAQATLGEYNASTYKKGTLKVSDYVCQRILSAYKLDESGWEDRIIMFWSEHKGMYRESAELEYMKVAQDLDMFGVSYFEIKNKKGSDLWLGVDAGGLSVYQQDDKLNPKVSFPWSEISTISFNDKKFTIEPIDKASPKFVFFSARLRINKRILQLCIGNHELYMRRRRADALEVQQLRQAALMAKQKREVEERRKREQANRDRRQSEIAVQKEAERLRLQRLIESAKNTPVVAEEPSKDELELLNRQAAQLANRRESTVEMDDENKSDVMKLQTIEEAAHVQKVKAEEDLKPVKVEYAQQQQNLDLKRRQTALKEELSVLAIKDRMNKLDAIHDTNIKEERNKYQTMRLIQKGLIKDRVGVFEGL